MCKQTASFGYLQSIYCICHSISLKAVKSVPELSICSVLHMCCGLYLLLEEQQLYVQFIQSEPTFMTFGS